MRLLISTIQVYSAVLHRNIYLPFTVASIFGVFVRKEKLQKRAY